MYVVRQSACLVVGSITICGCAFFFGCAMVGQALGLVVALAWVYDLLVGAWCLSIAGPTMAQLGVFFL